MIYSLAKNVIKHMIISVNIVKREVILKKRWARGTLFAPMQLPTMPQVASMIPIGIVISVAQTYAHTVIEANYVTPRMPEINIRNSKAHHYAQTMIVVGMETFRYSHQPVKASLLIGDSAWLI